MDKEKGYRNLYSSLFHGNFYGICYGGGIPYTNNSPTRIYDSQLNPPNIKWFRFRWTTPIKSKWCFMSPDFSDTRSQIFWSNGCQAVPFQIVWSVFFILVSINSLFKFDVVRSFNLRRKFSCHATKKIVCFMCLNEKKNFVVLKTNNKILNSYRQMPH